MGFSKAGTAFLTKRGKALKLVIGTETYIIPRSRLELILSGEMKETDVSLIVGDYRARSCESHAS